MLERQTPRHHEEAVIVGCMLISLGVLSNEFILEFFLAPDQTWSEGTRIKVRIFDAVLIAAGASLVLFRNHFAPRHTRWGRLHLGHLSKWLFLKSSSLLFILATLEIAALFLVADRDARMVSIRDPLVRFSKDLGIELLPDTRHTAARKLDSRSLFKTRSLTDAYGRRVVPLEDTEGRDTAVLFFGGSFMYGHGVEDDETLAYRAATLEPSYKSYNYGVPGYGPQQMLVKLRKGDLGDIGDPDDVILVYGFIPDHIRRVMGSMRTVAVFARHYPCFELDANDQLVHSGSFFEARPRRARLYNLLVDEAVMRYLNLDIPQRIDDDDIKLTVRVIEAARDEFKTRFNSDRFYVVFWPVPKHAQPLADRFAAWLQNTDLNVLDYSRLVDMDADGYVFDRIHDQHPTASTHARVAEALVADLKETGEPVTLSRSQ